MTGLSSIAPNLEGKRPGAAREVNPRLSHVAVLWNPANAFHVGSLKETRAAAQALGIKVLALSGPTAEQFTDAFAAIERERPDGLVVRRTWTRSSGAPGPVTCRSRSRPGSS
jgi:ABC-type uncharacterized transport system substrate-binding protein